MKIMDRFNLCLGGYGYDSHGPRTGAETCFHVTCTLPAELCGFARSRPKLVYALLFQAAISTLLELGRDPRWLGVQLGITAVLHTWSRRLHLHPHLHCIVTGGGLLLDQQRWLWAPLERPTHAPGFVPRACAILPAQ